jgi:hypothetical protein
MTTSDSAVGFCLTSEGEEVQNFIRTDSNSGMYSYTNTSHMSADLKDSVAFALGYSVPEVQAIFAQLNKRVLHVWCIVPGRDREVYRKIYAKEKEIIGQFGMIDFDFNVVSSNGRDPRELISDQDIQLAFRR